VSEDSVAPAAVAEDETLPETLVAEPDALTNAENEAEPGVEEVMAVAADEEDEAFEDPDDEPEEEESAPAAAPERTGRKRPDLSGVKVMKATTGDFLEDTPDSDGDDDLDDLPLPRRKPKRPDLSSARVMKATTGDFLESEDDEA
jgi:hypothetical protein